MDKPKLLERIHARDIAYADEDVIRTPDPDDLDCGEQLYSWDCPKCHWDWWRGTETPHAHNFD